MLKIYRFYLTYSDELYEYECNNKEDKKEMENDIVKNIFPNELYCMREKWIDGQLKYCNKFNLYQRRQDPYYINSYRLGRKQQAY